jgi:hypothetical protein
MSENPIDGFLKTDQEGHLSKIDGLHKKRDKILENPSQASETPPMNDELGEELGDEGSPLDDALADIAKQTTRTGPKP